MDKEYASFYSTLYKNHFWWRAREIFILESLKKIVPPNGFGNILDIGCGEGFSFKILSRFGKPEGVESDPLLTENAESGYKIYTAQFDENFKPLKKYECILMLDSLEHMPQAELVLGHVKELLTENGFLIITVPALMSLWTSHDDMNRHFIRFSKKALRTILGKLSFDIITMRYFFQWLVPLKIIQRIKERFIPAVHKLPHVPLWPINYSAFWLSRIEWFSYGRLLQLFGSSLFIIARLRSM